MKCPLPVARYSESYPTTAAVPGRRPEEESRIPTRLRRYKVGEPAFLQSTVQTACALPQALRLRRREWLPSQDFRRNGRSLCPSSFQFSSQSPCHLILGEIIARIADGVHKSADNSIAWNCVTCYGGANS